jgi:hypothetical protein
MAGGRSATGNEDESDDWWEGGDETTPTPTLSPLRKRKGEFNTLVCEIHPNNVQAFKK